MIEIETQLDDLKADTKSQVQDYATQQQIIMEKEVAYN